MTVEQAQTLPLKVWEIGMDNYITCSEGIFMFLFRDWVRSTCFKTEEQLIQAGAGQVDNDYLAANFRNNPPA